MTIDSVLGAVFQAIAFLLVVWFVAMPLATRLNGPIGEGLTG